MRLKWRYFSALGGNICYGERWKHLNETLRLSTVKSELFTRFIIAKLHDEKFPENKILEKW